MLQSDSSLKEQDLDSLRRACTDGNGAAMYRLALALFALDDITEAFEWQRRAAETGYIDAQIYYARMLLYGIVAAAEPGQAVEWLLRAEAAGSAVASYYLALIALGGVAVPRDHRINQRLHAAVQAGYPPALRAAAIHFGRKPHAGDQALCLQLLDQAARAGDAAAAALLAERLAQGEGIAQDVAAADGIRSQLAAGGARPLPAFRAIVPSQAASIPRQLAMEDALQACPAQLLASAPRVSVVDGLLSADECRLLIASAQPALRESRTIDPDTGLPIAMPIRTSSDASLDPIMEDLALRSVQLRMATAAGIDLTHAEHLTVLRYAPGQQYRPHRDYLPPGTLERDRPQAGNRVRTICVYLNAVEAGGETEFPIAGVRVAPLPGRAIVFDNLLADGSPDLDSLHAGLPVERGEKWLATLWIRERPYRDF